HVGPWTQHAGPSRGLLGDFGPRGLSVQYTGRPWVSASTLRTSVAVRQHTQDVRGYPCVSMCVCVYPSAHTGRPWLSISTHISTLALPWTVRVILAHVGYLFSRHMTSVEVRHYTQDVRVCPSAHRGRTWLSVCVRVCPSAHRGRPWLSVSTHISTVLGLSTLTLPVTGWKSGMSIGVRQHTQDVRDCLWLSVSTHRTAPLTVCGWSRAAHTGRQWAVPCGSLVVLGPVCVPCVVCPANTMTSVTVPISYTYQHVWSLGPQHAGPSRGCLGECCGSRGPPGPGAVTHRTSPWFVPPATPRTVWWLAVAVPAAHTGRPWLILCGSVCVGVWYRQHTQDVPPWLAISTISSTLVPWNLQPLALLWTVSVGTKMIEQQESTVEVPGLTTQDSVVLSPSAHRGRRGWSVVCFVVWPVKSTQKLRPWLSSSYTYKQTVPWNLATLAPFPWEPVFSGDVGPKWAVLFSDTHRTSVRVSTAAHTGMSGGCLCGFLSAAHMKTSNAVRRVWFRVNGRQHTQDVNVGWYLFSTTYLQSGPPWTQQQLPLPGGLGFGLNFFPTWACSPPCSVTHRKRPLVVQSAHNNRGRPPVALSRGVCPCVSVSTLKTSVAVYQYTYQHAGPWTQHAALPVDCSGDFGPRGLSVHTIRTSVAIRVCPSSHTGDPWLSISTHISTLVHGLARWPFPWTVWYTKDVRWCPPAHTGRPWLSVAVRQHTHDVSGCACVSVCVCVCPSAHTGRRWLSISTHISTLVLGLSMLALPVDCLGDFGPRGLSVQYTGRPWVSASTLRTSLAVRQHTQDVRGYPCVSMCVCVYPSAHTGRPWLSISTHISTLALPWTVRVILAHVGYLFSRHMTSVEVRHYTQDVRVCPSAHRGRTWLSVCVRVCPSAHRGRPWLSVRTHISTVLGLSTLTLPVTGWKSGWARWMMEAWMGRPKR
ncbi:hypothetical protein IGI04_042984, partial [Brassica rapa subsp. trilocularis]